MEMQFMADTVHHMRIELDGIDPPVWRHIAVPSDFNLYDLHEVIQVAMGWEEAHLHEFFLAGRGGKRRRTFTPRLDPMGGAIHDDDMEGEDESEVILGQLLYRAHMKLHYLYDFGDGWQHTIRVMRIAPRDPEQVYPCCLDGARACPPEDCGGVHGYYRVCEESRERAASAEEEEPGDYVFERFEPEAFDLDATNRWVQSMYSD